MVMKTDKNIAEKPADFKTSLSLLGEAERIVRDGKMVIIMTK
jgi:hypothetical protein